MTTGTYSTRGLKASYGGGSFLARCRPPQGDVELA